MIQQLTVEDLQLLRAALRALAKFDHHASNEVAQESQSGTQARMLVRLGEKERHRQELDFRLRERLQQLTGMPEILHGNADVASESSIYPMTREHQAQEANHRG